MSNFADPSRVEVLPLGPCLCPGAPHERDEATYRLEIGGGARKRISAYGWGITRGEWFDTSAAGNMLMVVGIASWNLVGAKGRAVPVTLDTVALLREDRRDLIEETLDRVLGEQPATLPNASGAPSRDGSEVSASPRRSHRRLKTRSSTTSSSR